VDGVEHEGADFWGDLGARLRQDVEDVEAAAWRVTSVNRDFGMRMVLEAWLFVMGSGLFVR
jgi:hypothetical protein